MSGPKISVYSLTGRARTIAFGQIRCEQQSLACYAQTQDMVRSLSAFLGNFDQQIRNLQLLMERTSEGAEQIAKLYALREELKTETEALKGELAAHIPRVSAKYRITEEAYAEKQAELKFLQALQARAETRTAQLEAVFQQDRETKARIQGSILEDLTAWNSGRDDASSLRFLPGENARTIQKLQASIVDAISGVNSFAADLEAEPPEPGVPEKKDALHRKLSGFLKEKALPSALQQEIQQAISTLQRMEDLPYLTTFDAVTVTGISRKIDTWRQEEEKRRGEYQALCARYQALCTMAGEEPEQLPASKAAVERLNDEVQRLELLLVRRQEQIYISDCVDEVMTDMGYDLIGSREVQKRNGKRFRNELFTFQEGTAVNVTFSSDGQISMEVGGLSREDRIPTEEETERLTREMETFCEEFAEFERRMLAKGIVIGRRVALLPPAPEYTAIININDYDIAASTQVSVLNAGEKGHKQAGKKELRWEK